MRLHLVQRLVLGRHVIGGVAAPSAGSGGSGGTVLAAAAASGDRHGLGGGRKPRGLVSASRALPLCAEALRASDAEVRQAATELLVLCHAASPDDAEAWLRLQPPMPAELLAQLEEHLSEARRKLARASFGSRPGTEPSGHGEPPGHGGHGRR